MVEAHTVEARVGEGNQPITRSYHRITPLPNCGPWLALHGFGGSPCSRLKKKAPVLRPLDRIGVDGVRLPVARQREPIAVLRATCQFRRNQSCTRRPELLDFARVLPGLRVVLELASLSCRT